MKKILSVLMTIAMLAALPFAAMAEETEMDTLLEGLVTELVDGGFVMQDVQQGEVMLNTSENTVWDGMLAETELAVGHYVFVEYDGRMTFSLPPQAHADRVVCNVLTGSVVEVLEDGSILMNDDTFGETIVHLGEGMNHVYAGMPITVYYDGIMTLSLPGQANASHIVLPMLSGAKARFLCGARCLIPAGEALSSLLALERAAQAGPAAEQRHIREAAEAYLSRLP